MYYRGKIGTPCVLGIQNVTQRFTERWLSGDASMNLLIMILLLYIISYKLYNNAETN